MNDKIKEITILITGALMALMGFLATLNIQYEWLTKESIDAFGVLITAVVVLVLTLYTVYKNTFIITKKAKQQKAELKRKGLK